MSTIRNEMEQALGMCSGAPTSGSAGSGSRRRGFDWCGIRGDDPMAGCPCGGMIRRHPIVAFAILACLGLAMLAVATGTVLGIIAFLR